MTSDAVRQRFGRIFLVFLTGILLYFCYVLIRPFFKPIVFAAVIAVVFQPVHARIMGRVGNPTRAALLSTALVILCMLVPAVLLGRAITQELSDAYEALSRGTAGKGGLGPYLTYLSGKLAGLLGRYINLSGFDLKVAIQSKLGQVTTFLLAWIAGLVKNIGPLALQTLVAFVTLFYLFRGGARLWREAVSILPLREDQVSRLAGAVNDIIIANMYGILSVAAAQGTLTGLAFWVLGVPSPVLWGVVTSMFSLIPVIGSAAVWLPAAIILLATGAWWKGLVLLGWGVGVVGLIDNVIRPLVITQRVKLHTLYVLVAVLGGIRAFGLLGLFLGPVILSVTITLLKMLAEERRVWQGAKGEVDFGLANRAEAADGAEGQDGETEPHQVR